MENLKIGNRKTLPAGKYVVTEFEDIRYSNSTYVPIETKEAVIEAAKMGNIGKVVGINGKSLIVVHMPLRSDASHPINGETIGKHITRTSELVAIVPLEMLINCNGIDLYTELLGDIQFEASEDFECISDGDILKLGEVALKEGRPPLTAEDFLEPEITTSG